MRKRFISLILAIMFLLTFIPVTSAAEAPSNLYKSAAAGTDCSFIIKSDGSLWAWGGNTYGQLGDGTNEDRYIKKEIMINTAQVSAGLSHILAVTNDGILWSWGENDQGKLGDGTTTVYDKDRINTLIDGNKNTPTNIMENVVSACAGYFHSLAIKSDGSLWAWGDNIYGQLGDGTSGSKADKFSPVKIMSGAVSVSAGKYHSLAIKSDGSLWAWGDNTYSQLGNSSLGKGVSAPALLKSMDGVTAVASGMYHCLALKKDGSVWAWGDNTYGQLGDGTNQKRSEPVKIMDGVMSIAAGPNSGFAIKKDGSLWLWGQNYYGQFGDGTGYSKISSRSSPVKVTENVVSVSSGGSHCFAIKQNGSLWAWGDNSNGQVGDGTFETKSSPVRLSETPLKGTDAARYESNLKIYDSKWTDSNTLAYYKMPSKNVQSGDKDIAALAQSIIKDKTSDYDKVRAVYDWVVNNIFYDYDLYGKLMGSKPDYTDGKTDAAGTLKNKRSVCEGYSNLTAALLRAINIPAKIVIGRMNSEQQLHAWNEAFVDDKWVIIDTTYDSNNKYEDGKFYVIKPKKSVYFDISLEMLSKGREYYDYTDYSYINGKVSANRPQEVKTKEVTPANLNLTVNGKKTSCGTYIISGNYYIKLCDVAYILNGTPKQFDINSDSNAQRIIIKSNKSYTAGGDELITISSPAKIGTLSALRFFKDDVKVNITSYTIGGSDYIKLSDIGKVMNFNIEPLKKSFRIDTSRGFSFR